MDCVDLLQQSSYSSDSPHPPTTYDQQQDQMTASLDQDKSPHQPEGRADLESNEEVRRNDSGNNNNNSGSGNKVGVVVQDNGSSSQAGGNGALSYAQSENNLTGQATEIENPLQRLDFNDKSDGPAQKDNADSGEKEEESNDCDEEEAFDALCTEASFLLNKQNPNRRYYINKLYQPLNGHQDETPLDEQDYEYLLYQELGFDSDDIQRVQLTKILEDDEGDEVADHLVNDAQHEDPLDRLHLNTNMEAFESFPTSPFIEHCHPLSDPLIGGVCVDDQCQDKPDSTRNGQSPIRSGNSNNYIGLTQNHQQFNCEQSHLQLTNEISHPHDQESHFSVVNPSINNDPHHSHLLHDNSHHQHQLDDQQQYAHHMNTDTSSESNCFQQVSSTLISPEELSNSNHHDFMSSFNSSSEMYQQPHQQQIQENSSTKTQHSNLEKKQPKKRNLQQVSEFEENGMKPLSSKAIKNRAKRKRVVNAEGMTKNNQSICENSASPIDRVTSSMINQIEMPDHCGIADSDDNANKFSGNHYDNSMTAVEYGDEGSLSMEEGSVVSNEGRGHTSKYRRRTANARERIRMREINQAFEKLKKVVPIEMIQQSASGDESDQTSVSSRRGGKSVSNNNGSDSQSVKLTKITTLRLAVSYIAKLSEVLSQYPEGSSLNLESRNNDIEGSATSDLTGTLKLTSGDSSRGRKRRVRRSSAKKDVLQKRPTKIKADKTLETDEIATSDTLSNSIKKGPLEHRIEPAFMINQSGQRRPILIANNVLNGGLQQQTATFVPLQRRVHQEQQQPQHFAYTNCGQQPITISQTATSNGQDRTFVTPVAVAILGIPTANGRVANEHQGLQLVNIQNAQTLQQRAQPIQTTAPYSLISQQPQQVAFTLDDINGVSVLRLANAQNHAHHQQAIQFQQPQVLTTAQTAGYNYTTTYQPVHISQVQSATNVTTIRPLAGQQHQPTTTVQFRTCNSVNGRTQETHLVQLNNDLRFSQRDIAISDNGIVTAASSTPTLTTGTNSDCKSFSISPNMIAQHLSNNNNNYINNNNNIIGSNSNINNNNSNSVQGTQFKIQQSNCTEGQLSPSNNTNSQGTRIFHTQPVSRCGTISSQANVIFINPANLTNANNFPNSVMQQQQQAPRARQHLEQTSSCHESNSNNQSNSGTDSISANNNQLGSSQANTQTSNSSAHYEQMKFITQFSSQANQSQDKTFHANEANIRQLVASLATSIQPNVDQSSKANQDEQVPEQQQQQQQQQQRQQPKRTYRFHNYDGSMITNHLYNHHDKSSHHQQDQPQQPSKKAGQQQQQKQPQPQIIQLNQSVAATPTTTTTTNLPSGTSQRSRQNSLSSTCSTNSCSSSSLTSLSTASPMLSMLAKSPSPENGGTALA